MLAAGTDAINAFSKSPDIAARANVAHHREQVEADRVFLLKWT